MTLSDDTDAALSSLERARVRLSKLEKLYAALKANVDTKGTERGTNSVTWRKVLECMREVEKTDR